MQQDFPFYAFPRRSNPPRSEIYVTGGNGYGSVYDHIRRLTTLRVQLGDAITYKDSPAYGGSFQINVDGVYAITAQDETDNATAFGVSRNTTQPTVSIASIPVIERIAFAFNPEGATVSQVPACVTLFCKSGDIIRLHTDAVGAQTSDLIVNFRITQVSV